MKKNTASRLRRWWAPTLLIGVSLLLPASTAVAAEPTGMQAPSNCPRTYDQDEQPAPEARTRPSLSGDTLAELTAIQRNGSIVAWCNLRGFANMPWARGQVVVGTGFSPGRVQFADLNGDGKSELLYIQPNGQVRAWLNLRGFTNMPWAPNSVIIATGFSDPARARFADIDGDGKADAQYIQANGNVTAWRNVRGYAAMPWGGAAVVLATGFRVPTRAQFTDLNGDGRAEAVYVLSNGAVRAWLNVRGFAPLPWARNPVIIATGFSDPTRMKFADLDGDGRSDITYVQVRGNIEAWRNVAGYRRLPFGKQSVTVGTGFGNPAMAVFA